MRNETNINGEKVMKALFSIATRSGLKGILSVNANKNMVVSLNGNQTFVSHAVLNTTNGNYVSLSPKNTEDLLGKKVAAKIGIISFADGSQIPSGNEVCVSDTLRLGLDIMEEISKKEEISVLSPNFDGSMIDSGAGFKMRNTERNHALVDLQSKRMMTSTDSSIY